MPTAVDVAAATVPHLEHHDTAVVVLSAAGNLLAGQSWKQRQRQPEQINNMHISSSDIQVNIDHTFTLLASLKQFFSLMETTIL